MTMTPPPRPAHIATDDGKRDATPALSTTSDSSTTKSEQAQRAWGTLMEHMENDPDIFHGRDFVWMGELKGKLKVR